jgi:hypothetical protein
MVQYYGKTMIPRSVPMLYHGNNLVPYFTTMVYHGTKFTNHSIIMNTSSTIVFTMVLLLYSSITTALPW